MPLPDPELELLRELLKDDPGNEIFLEVGKDLMERREWADAVDVLATGLAEEPGEEDGWPLLARAAYESGQFTRSLDALEKLDTDAKTNIEMARILVLALEGAGKFDAASEKAQAFLADAPGDPVIEAALERMASPQTQIKRTTSDPMISVERAEEYAAIGRVDRAIRVYRRLLHLFPDDRSLAGRLAELRNQPFEVADDLSEEIPRDDVTEALQGPPPGFTMPSPNLGGADAPPVSARDLPANADDELTDPNVDIDFIRDAIEKRRHAKSGDKDDNEEFIYGASDNGSVDGDDEPTAVNTQIEGASPEELEARIERAKSKKRRSLLGR